MNQEPRRLDPTVTADAIDIIDQFLQPNVILNREMFGVAEVCMRTIRKALQPPEATP